MILYFSKNEKEHIEHLKTVFDIIQKAGIKLNKEKCVFAEKEVKILGHVIKTEGVKADPERV